MFSRDLENSVKTYSTSQEERKSRDLTNKLFVFNQINFHVQALLFKCGFGFFTASILLRIKQTYQWNGNSKNFNSNIKQTTTK